MDWTAGRPVGYSCGMSASRPVPESPVFSGAHRGLQRGLSVMLLVLQALVWGGGSILEAEAAAASLTQVTHVEDESSTACPPIHSHVDCLVCRTLTGGAASGSAPTVPTVAQCGQSQPVSVVATAADAGVPAYLGSRAPPSA